MEIQRGSTMNLKEEVLEAKKQLNELKEKSDLVRILTIEDKKNKRLCWIIALLIILLVASLGYIIYLHNDIGTEVIEETETYDMDAENGINNVIGGDNNGTNEIHQN